MIKNVVVCICDICGDAEKAKVFGYQYNEPCHDMPDGWTRGKTEGTHICPICSAALAARGKEKRG